MHSRLPLALLAALACLPVPGHAQQCAAGYAPATVTGRVTTLNISETRQVGQICLVLTAADGREVFDNCGSLIGKVTALDVATGTSTLSHTAMFDLADTFRTVGDVGQVIGVLETDADGTPCAMSVREHMTNLQLGTGVFAGATLDVVADGSISFCPGQNHNSFQLSGQGCVHSKRR